MTIQQAGRDLGSAEAEFTLPEGGTETLLATVSEHMGQAPVVVYERLDPATREPQASWIGLAATDVVDSSRPSSDRFAMLRDAIQGSAGTGSSGIYIAAFSYPDAEPGLPEENGPPVVILRLDEYLYLDHRRGTGYAVCREGAAGADETRGRSASDWARICAAATSPKSEHAARPEEGDFRWRPELEVSDFQTMTSSAQTRIAAGDAAGVVLSVRQRSETVCDPLPSYLALRAINPSPCMFLLRKDAYAMWGATSLAMAQIADGHLLAETDGATRSVPDTHDRERFVWHPDEKELDEYRIVADALKHDLSAVVAPGSLHATRELEQREFFGLRHLFAEMQADMASDQDAVDAIGALYPHGAAVGYPRQAALELIASLEAEPRGPFAGMIGVFGTDGSADAACVTRSMWTAPAGSFVQAGAKIVAASDSATEYAECLLKTAALRQSARAHRDDR